MSHWSESARLTPFKKKRKKKKKKKKRTRREKKRVGCRGKFW